LEFIPPAAEYGITQETYQRKGHEYQEDRRDRKKYDAVQYVGRAAVLEGVPEKGV
jgi:hypothetical protein